MNRPEFLQISAGFGRSARVPNVRFLPLTSFYGAAGRNSATPIPRQIKAPSPDRDPDAPAAQKVETDNAVAKVPIAAERGRLLRQHMGIRVSRYRGTDLDGIKPKDV